jgi:hypothetical protein
MSLIHIAKWTWTWSSLNSWYPDFFIHHLVPYGNLYIPFGGLLTEIRFGAKQNENKVNFKPNLCDGVKHVINKHLN